MRRIGTVALLAVLLLAAAACEPRIGNRDGSFGNNLNGDLDGDGYWDPGDCVAPLGSCAGSQPLLWAAVNSPFYGNENGDPFSSRCLVGTADPCTMTNPEFRPAGYTFGVEVREAGQLVTVQIYDAPAYGGSTANYTTDQGSFRTGFGLFAEDGDPATASTAPGLSMAGHCSSGPGGRVFPGNTSPQTYHNRWWTLCTFTAPVAGTYPLVVRTSDLPADPSTSSPACLEPTPCTETGGKGINGFAVRATTPSGPQPVVAAIGDMSIYTVTPNVTNEVDLIAVGPSAVGSQLVVDLYDPGDFPDGSASMSLVAPGGASLPCTLAYTGTNGIRTSNPIAVEHLAESCTFVTRDPAAATPNRFNSRWVRLTVDIPDGYTCPADDCWWKLASSTSGGTPSERLTVAAHVEHPT